MGPVRHKQLIRLLAFVVTLDLAVGVVALYALGGTATAANQGARTSRAGDAAGLGTGAEPGGILAGGQFTRRRGSGRKSTGATPQGAAGTAAPASPAGSSTSTATAPARPGSTTPSSTGRPTTTSTGRPVTSSTAPPKTSSTSGPGRTTGTAPNSAPGATGPKGSDGSPATNAPAKSQATNATFTDRPGDTVVDGSGNAKAERRADIIQSHVTYASGAIIFAVLTDDPVDPQQDPHWASDSTFVTWELDTNGDAKPDYEVQYLLSEGSVAAGVSRVGDTEGDSLCEAEAAYTSKRYAVGFDSACLDRPGEFSYRVKIYYDTDPKNEDADVITDVAPDGGLSRPVARPAG